MGIRFSNPALPCLLLRVVPIKDKIFEAYARLPSHNLEA